MMENVPQGQITNVLLGAVLMPNGEVICNGRTIGWFDELSIHLYEVKTKSLLAGLTIEKKKKKVCTTPTAICYGHSVFGNVCDVCERNNNTTPPTICHGHSTI